MADDSERLEGIEQALGSMNEQLRNIRERLDQGDERFNQIDERFNQVDERFNQVDERFNQVDERFNQVDKRFDAVGKRIDSLAVDVHQLRVLGESNSEQIKIIAEVQSRHGEKLDELAKGIEPLKDLRDFVQRIAHEHERRITELEKGM